MIDVRVELGPRSYPIRVVAGRPADLGAFARDVLGATRREARRVALVVTDANVAPQADRVAAELAAVGIVASTAVVPPGEATKSLDHAARLLDRLVRLRADRQAVVVAVGGGVVGDLAGFVAATYARGVALVMVPTTLLAMVDSAVGGKVGVNHPLAKNIIGAFHQPAGVWVDLDALDTLPDRELRCGLAEVVKYGAILDPEFFGSLETAAGAILARDRGTLGRVVARCCALKAEVVAQDEREETGVRAVLNFGHTVGHAIEAVAGYDGAFRHGEAVSVGMVAEARLAERLGWVGPEVAARLARLLARFGLPTEAPGLDPEALVAAMGRDKKNRGGQVRFVLPRAIGRVEPAGADPDAIRAALAAVGAGA